MGNIHLTSTNYSYKYKNDKPIIINVFGYVFALFAIILLVNFSIVGVLFLIIALALFVYQTGIEVNFDNNQMRYTHLFGPFAFGTWQAMPTLDYISVFSANLISEVTSRAHITLTSKNREIQVNLIGKEKQIIKLYQTDIDKDAFAVAKELAQKLKLKIYDATTTEPEWID